MATPRVTRPSLRIEHSLRMFIVWVCPLLSELHTTVKHFVAIPGFLATSIVEGVVKIFFTKSLHSYWVVLVSQLFLYYNWDKYTISEYTVLYFIQIRKYLARNCPSTKCFLSYVVLRNQVVLKFTYLVNASLSDHVKIFLILFRL